MAQYLVVAHRTLVGDDLLEEVRRRIGPQSSFHLLVPVQHPADHAWSNGEVEAVARVRLAEGLDRFLDLGADVTGEVGDVDPVTAISTAIRTRALTGAPLFDEILLSTLPAGVSRWLRIDVVHRTQVRTGLPVTHVVGSRRAVAAS